MIAYSDGVFSLSGKGFSYLFRLTGSGQPEHLHFGPVVSTRDAQALACKPGTGWGDSILYDQDSKLCLNFPPLEWSGSGRGDYRESPIFIERDGEAIPTDFRYVSHEIVDGPIPSTLPQARYGGESLKLTLEDPRGLRLHLIYTVFDDAITRRAVLENNTKDAITLRKLMSFCLDLPGKLEMTSFGGGWAAEMRAATASVSWNRIVSESTTGFSSSRAQAGFLLCEEGAGEDSGVVYGINLIYTGNHYASAQRSLQGLNRVMQGISPDSFGWPLAPGEGFETPEAVLCWSDQGKNGMSERMHRFVNRHIIPKAWQYRERPVLYNSWEGCVFDFNQARLLSLGRQARELGCELFVLDDGWFGARNSDTAGLGDYTVNRKKLPEGLDGLGRALNKMGLQFGLWFEPEAVNPDSDLYRLHPDWALTDELPQLYGRNELLLDLTRQEVRDYIVENVSRVLDSAPISYVKCDMNRSSIALGARAHRYILGLYEVLDRIFTPRPEILLESCSSGGNRFDLGMLCFSPQVWASDNTDPIARLEIQQNLSYLYPQSTIGAHVSAAPHGQTLRNTPLYTRGNVAFFGCLGYELDLKELAAVERQEIRGQVEFYKKYRRIFQFGSFRRISTEEGICWQVGDVHTRLAGLYHLLQPTAPGYERLRVPGLKPEKTYTLESRRQLLRMRQFGGMINHVLPVKLNPEGAVIRQADRRYAMKDGREHFTATGAALGQGVMLSSRFTGTGYDPDLRLHTDFGSNVYVIEEEASHEKSE